MHATYCRLCVSVSATPMMVIRAARRKIARQHRRGRTMRMQRHAFYRAMLAEHNEARALYLRVMRGM